jgi:hypothetical protein
MMRPLHGHDGAIEERSLSCRRLMHELHDAERDLEDTRLDV